MSTPNTVLVTGANGNVGRHLTNLLVDAGVNTRALVTNSANRPSCSKIDLSVGNLADPDSLLPALSGVDKVFLLMTLLPGVDDFRSITSAIAQAGIQHVVLLSSVTVFSGPENVLGELNRQAELAVVESGVPYTFLRAGAFHSNALAWSAGVRQHGVVSDAYGHFVSSPVDPRDIAEVAALTLTGSNHEDLSYPLSGPEKLSSRDQVAALAEVLDRTIAFNELGTDKARQLMVSAGRTPERVDSLLTMQRNNDDYLSDIHPTIIDLLGRPPTSFQRWARDHSAAFR